MKLSLDRSFGTALGLFPPVAVIVAAGALCTSQGGTAPQRLHALELVPPDLDGDGLSDRQERILQTSIYLADTDGDGFSDTEEFARGTSPLFAGLLPPQGRLRAGMTARVEQGVLHVLLGVYLPDMELRGKDFEIGLVSHQRMVILPREEILSLATVSFAATTSSQAAIALIDVPFQPWIVEALGELNLFVTVGSNGGIVAASDSIRLKSTDGVIVLCMPDPFIPPPSASGGQSTQQTGSVPTPGGTIFVPLIMGDDPPALWTPGQICYQRASPVGAVGMLVTNEVTRAECMDNWDAFCPPSCSTAVGSTYTDVDPLALLGG